MPNKFMSKVAWVFVMLIIGAIIMSFALTGIGGGGGGGNRATGQAVAKVDGTPINYGEFQKTFQQMLNYYSSMMGGKSLTSKDIELFGIRRRALQQIIDQKLVLNFANDMDIDPSLTEIQKDIEDRPYFKTNGQFDVSKYKQLLRQNKFTPADFESSVADDLRYKKIGVLLGFQLVSKNYLNDLVKYKNLKTKATIIKLNKDELKKYITIPKKEIRAYVADKSHEGKLKALYQANQSDYVKPEQVSAAHILIKAKGDDKDALKKIQKIAKQVTLKNFASMANKYTEDPSGKGKGGDLGTFKKGVMDPAFEKTAFSQKRNSISAPVKSSFGYHLIHVTKKIKGQTKTFEQAQNALAKEMLQSTDKEGLSKVAKKIGKKIEHALARNKNIEKLQSEYSFILEKNKVLNRLDAKIGSIELNEQKLATIFPNNKINLGIHAFDDPAHLVLIKTSRYKAPKKKKNSKKPEDEYTTEESSQKYYIAKKVRAEMMKDMQENASIAVYDKNL